MESTGSAQQPSPPNSLTSGKQKHESDLRSECASPRDPQEQFRLLADCVKDYAFILYDTNANITAWSKGAERVIGYTEAEILGQSGAILFTPEDRENGASAGEVITAREEGRAEDERWHLKKDGTRFWASGVLTSLRDADGHLVGFAKVMRDLTERRKAEEALRHSEERFRLFVDNVRDYALFQVDAEARVCGWNPGAERLFGYPEEEILGQRFARLFCPDDAVRGEAEDELMRTLAEGHVKDERWMIRKDGSRFYARWVTTPMYDDGGQLRGFAKVLQDETDRVHLETIRQRLEQRERKLMSEEVDRTKAELRALAASLLTAQEDERRRIARELHDDLAQRLAIIDLEIEQIRQDLPSGTADPVKAHLARLRAKVAEVSEDVRNLSHRLHPSVLEDLGLEPALRSLIADFEQTHGTAAQLTSALSGPVPVAVATTLYRIAQEALRNAAKYAGDALITVTLASTEHEVHLRIHDDGAGFDPEAVRAKGGLGVVSMHERAHLAGGHLVIRSAPGQGTEIIATIPSAGA